QVWAVAELLAGALSRPATETPQRLGAAGCNMAPLPGSTPWTSLLGETDVPEIRLLRGQPCRSTMLRPRTAWTVPGLKSELIAVGRLMDVGEHAARLKHTHGAGRMGN